MACVCEQHALTPELQGPAPARARPDATHAVRQPPHPGTRISQLQRSAGNQGAQRILQKKLALSQPGDAFEREADRVAAEVTTESLRSASPPKLAGGLGGNAPLQRKCSCGGTCPSCQEEAEQVQRKAKPSVAASEALGNAPPLVHDVVSSAGQPLDPATRAYFEPRFGYDLSGVRVHDDGRAAESARTVSAVAYTLGHHIIFGQGQLAPRSIAGRKLIAHELAHVVQQGGGAALGTIQRQAMAHTGPADPAIVTSVPSEKRSEIIEHQYRMRGDSTRADAIAGCRMQGGAACARLLTINEVHRLFALGRNAKGDREQVARGLVGVEPQLAKQVLELVKARPPAPQATVGVPEAPVGVPEGPIAGVSAAAILLLVLTELKFLSEFAVFQSELRARGFIILESPLALCVGGCHIHLLRTGPQITPQMLKGPEKLPPDVVQSWLEQQQPAAASRQPPHQCRKARISQGVRSRQA